MRIIKIILIALVIFWSAFAAFGNIIDFSDTRSQVASIVSMDHIEGEKPWQATTNSIVIGIGALIIVIGELLTALFCSIGLVHMSRYLRADAAAFQDAKRFAVIGCGIGASMLFGAFIVVAEGFYLMWQSPIGATVANIAFRVGAFFLLIGIFVSMKE